MNRKLLVLLIFISNLSLGQTYISSDTTWLSDTLIVNEDIIITEGARLDIKPGKVIKFENYSGLLVLGELYAIGELSDSVYFLSADTINFADTSSVLGGWKGICFLNNLQDSSSLEFCRISNGKANGFKSFIQDSTLSETGGGIIVKGFDNLLVKNSSLTNNYASKKGAGIFIKSSENIKIEDCLFRRNKTFYDGGGVYLLNSKVEIINNRFDLNTAYRVDTVGGYLYRSGTGSSIFGSFCPYNYPVVRNNIISRGRGVSGALYDNNSKSTIVNNIIVNNNDIGFFNGHSGSYTIFYNNIVANNYRGSPTHSGLVIFSKFLPILNCIYGAMSQVTWKNHLK